VLSKARSQLKNVSVRAAATVVPEQATNGRASKVAWGVAGALAATGTVLYVRSKPVRAAETNLAKQKEYFDKYASITAPNGEHMMTPEDFLRAITDAEPEDARKRGALDEAKFRILFSIADVDNTGTISFNEYVHFEDVINRPDAEYVLAFKIFDRDGNGKISKDDFRQVVSTSFLSDSKIPFDFECELVRLYFGKGNSELDYSQFTQLLKDLQQERVKQEFRFYDKEQSGYIPVDKFAKILAAVKLRRIPPYVKEHLTAVANLNKGTSNEGSVSYAQFVACNDMLLHIPSYGRVLRAACQRAKTNMITKDEFLREAHHTTSIEITRLEADVVWEIFDTDRDGKLSLLDFNKVTAPPRPTTVSAPARSQEKKTIAAAFLESVENFALGAVAGAVGATAVYPIDLVKTRMQNQRVVDPSKRVYANSWDCFTKVLKNEGAVGLYKGLGPQIVGVAPEKAIKLTVNDLLRGLFEDKSKGEIYFPLEVLAGGGAGASQVLFTNPLEIVKIRLQVQGEGGKGIKGAGAMQIVRELGFAGLYKGAGACLLRDIPFSAIYFPTYAKMKEMLKDENGKLSATDLLLAGAVAGIPAASLVTPADVIKTRLQVKARAGEQTYTGIRDCFWKVLTAEGPKAFFKGCVARVCRSSPQFGVTLLTYEVLQQFFAPHVTPRPPTNAPITEKEYADIRGTVVKVEEMEKKFGHLTSADKKTEEEEEEEEKKKKEKRH